MSAPVRKAPAKKAAVKRSPRAAKPAAAPEVEPELTDEELEALAEDEADEQKFGEDGSFEPVEIGKRGRTPNELVTLFTLDDVAYQVPSKPSPALLIRFQKELVKKGRDFAIVNLLNSLLGDEALDALAESPEVTEDDMADIYDRLTVIAFGTGVLERIRAAADPS